MTRRRTSLVRAGWAAAALVLPVALSSCRDKGPPRPPGNTTLLTFSRVERAWAHGKGRGITVAVMDWQFDRRSPTGMPYVHPTTLIPGETIGDLEPWHGSWMVGIVHAVAPEASIMPIIARSLKRGYAEVLPAGIRYAADHGASVVTSSMGPAEATPALREAVAYALGKGCVFVDVHPERVTDATGKTRACGPGECPEGVVHPGLVSVPAHPTKPDRARDIYVWPYDLESAYKDGWGYSNGPPQVAGVVALMLGANRSLTPPEVKRLLVATGDMRDGFLVLDAEAAVRAAVASARP